uniref:PX domain-containing protein n=1 Tax=Plectus sambesii TaxID=2011161 RepID=A0A914UNS1_9BILA
EHASGGASMSGHSRGGTDAASKGTVRMKNINRFSNFVKSGMEGYILKPVKLSTQPAERHEIILSNEGPQWAPITQLYNCSVDKPKKESKMKGLKSYIAYSLTSSLSGIQVSRRYKHFDWLHERLTEKYILTPIPPLPEKQVSGRYEEDLIEHRKQILQLWVNKLCRHPVLSQSDVWIHFLTCTDEKQWKIGKRKSEKDEYTGGNFFQSITIPGQPLDTAEVERHVETFSRMTRSLDDSVRGLFDRANETHKRHIGPYKASFQKMASAFEALGHSFELDQSPHNQSITQAIKQTSTVYRTIGDMHEQQPKKDLEPLLDALYAYKGMLSTVPDIVHVHKSALSKLKENEKLSAEGKIPQAEAEAVRMRVDTTSYAMLAEINHFSKERVADFKVTMVDYLRQQVHFYEQIAAQLQGALIQFENV